MLYMHCASEMVRSPLSYLHSYWKSTGLPISSLLYDTHIHKPQLIFLWVNQFAFQKKSILLAVFNNLFWQILFISMLKGIKYATMKKEIQIKPMKDLCTLLIM